MSADAMVIEYQPDQAGLAAQLLLWQFSRAPRMLAFARALGAAAQITEDMAWALIVGGGFDAATGATLDRWGEVVGEIRGGLSHEDYRRFIELRIRVNTENPDDEAMGSILTAAVTPSTVTSYLVADGIVYVVESGNDGSGFLDGAIAAHTGALIRDLRPVGIYAAVVEHDSGHQTLIGSIAVPGTLIGSIAVPGTEIIGRLIYSGR